MSVKEANRKLWNSQNIYDPHYSFSNQPVSGRYQPDQLNYSIHK